MDESKKNASLARTRSEPEKIRDRLAIMNLYFQNVPIKEIPDKLQEKTESEYKLSRYTISKVIETSIDEWKQQEMLNVDEMKKKELAKLDALEQEYWYGWKRSLRPLLKKVSKRIRVKTGDLEVDESGEVVASTKFIDDEIVQTEIEKTGDAKFLEGVERCIFKRCQILGLLQPLRFGVPENPGNENYGELPLTIIQQRLIAIFNVKDG